MSNHLPPHEKSQATEQNMLYSDHPDFVPDEETDDAIGSVPVVRTGGAVDHGWRRIGTLGDYIVLVKGDMQKVQTPEQLDQARTRWDQQHPPRQPELPPPATLCAMGGVAARDVDNPLDYCLTPEQIGVLRAQHAALNEPGIGAQGEQSRSTEASSAEQLLVGLSQEDVDALKRFALSAWSKRNAQRVGDGDMSIRHSGEIGTALKKMTPSAKAVAERYARARYGDVNVAF